MIVANRDATKVEEFDEEMNACLLSGSSIATSVQGDNPINTSNKKTTFVEKTNIEEVIQQIRASEHNLNSK